MLVLYIPHASPLPFPHELLLLSSREFPLVIETIPRPAVSMRMVVGVDSVPSQLVYSMFRDWGAGGVQSKCSPARRGGIWHVSNDQSDGLHGGERKTSGGHTRRPLGGV